ncbi:hypothetical protein [Nonomuraea dietziae]|uniref:Uncharacterized protein n=1 Tax=Nonomuraea dietziae TaxID=65515 RepID=A0A7W5Y9Q3_9ACTN|nr:hypothetical protein [Nonomuraea dietziae]MBB3729711.1 hypothetical protein [Nonomuraea dietziae]
MVRFFVAALIAIQTCIIMLSGSASAAPARFTPAADDASAEAPPPIIGTYRPGGVIETARWYVAEAHQPKARPHRAQQSPLSRSAANRPAGRRVEAPRYEARHVETPRYEARHVEAPRSEARHVEAARHEARRVEAPRFKARHVEARHAQTRTWRTRESAALLSRALPRHAVRVSHAFAIDRLAQEGLSWKSSGHCADRHNRVCTSMQAMRSETLAGVIDLKRESGCKVVVTGGTEAGHAPGAFSHAAGYKIDIRHSECVDRHITRTYPKVGVRSDGAALYRSADGALFASESDHWDILFR